VHDPLGGLHAEERKQLEECETASDGCVADSERGPATAPIDDETTDTRDEDTDDDGADEGQVPMTGGVEERSPFVRIRRDQEIGNEVSDPHRSECDPRQPGSISSAENPQTATTLHLSSILGPPTD
jgi:hypothetical protein